MKKQKLKKSFLLLAILGLVSINMSAQNATFTNADGTNWTTLANWSTGVIPGATNEATIQANADLNGNQTLGQIKIFGAHADPITITGGASDVLTLAGTGALINNNINNVVTFDCDIDATANGRFQSKNNTSTRLYFAANRTINVGSNNVSIRNFSTFNPVEFRGNLKGTSSGLFILDGTDSDAWTGMIFTNTADNTNFEGIMTAYNKLIISNIVSPKLFLPSTGTLRFQREGSTVTITGENTMEGNVLRFDYTGTDAGSGAILDLDANQNNMGNLNLGATTSDKLTIDIDAAVTNLVFASTSIDPSATLNLVGYTPGVIKFGSTLTQTELDAIEKNGTAAPNTFSQNFSGYLIDYIPPAATISSHPGVSGVDDGSTMNWEDTTTWIGGVVPASGDNIIINGKVVINSDVVTGDITLVNKDTGSDPFVGDPVSLNIQPGFSLTVNGTAITKNNLFAVSNATTSGSLIFNGSISGQVQYYKYVNATPNNDLIAFPTAENVGNDGSFDGFMDNGANNTGIYKNPADDSVRLFGPFDNAVAGGNYVNYDSDIPSDLLIPVVAAKGYRIAHATGGALRFKKNSFENISNITIAITDEIGTNATSGEWNLVGNSYPAYMNFTSFYNGNSAQFDGTHNGVYGYDGDGTFTSYNLLNKPTDDKIAPLQGFFVKAKTGGGTLTLNPAWREIGTQDDFIAGKTTSKSENKALARISLKDGDKSYSTDVYFVDNASKGLDRGYDTGAFFLQSKGIYTHLVEESNGDALAIQALAYEDFNNVSVPLVINANLGSQLSIKIDGLKSTLPSNIYLYLEDTANNTLTILNSEDYKFTADADLKGSGRYYIRFSSKVLSTATVSLNKLEIYAVSKTLFINGSLQNNSKVSVFDIQGRTVITNDLDSELNSNSLDVSKLSNGVYIIKVNNGKQTETKKVIIN